MAQPLPDNLDTMVLPKYVTYNRDKITTKTRSYYREFFRIEKHPNLHLLDNGKLWSSSKSEKVDINEKLKQTIEILNQLNTMTEKTISKVERDLPQYITIGNKKRNGKIEKVLCYEKRTDTVRQNLCMKIASDQPSDQELEKFQKKIAVKYG